MTLGPEACALVEVGRAAFCPDVRDRTRLLEALRARIEGAPHGHGESEMPSSAALGGGWPARVVMLLGVVLLGGLALDFPGEEAWNAIDGPPVMAPPPRTTPVTVALDAHTPLASPRVAASPEPARALGARRPADHLAEEVSILARAESELNSGRFASALSLLDEHRRRFPQGTLTEERVAARVSALCALGRGAEAESALQRLPPGSLHGGRAREACARGAPR